MPSAKERSREIKTGDDQGAVRTDSTKAYR